MSFSFDTKKSICANQNTQQMIRFAECYGMLLFSKKFTYNEIVFTTENKYVSSHITDLLTEFYTPIIETTCGLKARNSTHQLITLKLMSSDDCGRIFKDYGYSDSELSIRINRANISEEGQVSAFLRGVFLTCGSVTDPEKGYHLEFKVPFRNLANDLLTLLCEVEECNLKPKSVVRQGYYIVYFKDSEQIADFLTYIGATESSMEIMGVKVMKQIKNNAIRRYNSEMHNINKIADASAKQRRAIKKLMNSDVYNSLSPELKEMAQLRLDYPELSLRDLGELTTDKISRSGVNHRLKKLISYTDEV